METLIGIVCSEGLNGRLPNQDLVNSFQRIARYTAQVPVVLYDHIDPMDDPAVRQTLSNKLAWIHGGLGGNELVLGYAHAAQNIIRHVYYQARGQPSGTHGLFNRQLIHTTNLTVYDIYEQVPH